MSVLNTQEVAELLECNTRKVHYLIQKGKIKPIKEYDRFFIFDEKQVIDYKRRKESHNG